MLFRQLFDHESSTFTYLLADQPGGEALIIDPVMENVPQYLELVNELGLQLVMAVDTHVHADHISGAPMLRDSARCMYAMGSETRAECLTYRFSDDDILNIGALTLRALYTPGHTDDSYSLVMNDRVFTGDTLLIRGTGRTDFQNGDAGAQYDSIFGRLLTLPDDMLVYPAHDYEGRTCSSIFEERHFNPRLQVDSREQYIDRMNALQLDPPRKMGVAVPANINCGSRRVA
jgi:sulfur dioxygenase